MGRVTEAAILCLLGFSTAFLMSQVSSPPSDRAQDIHVRDLIDSLPPESPWREMMLRGARGDGVHHAWMDRMGKQHVKLAVFSYEFQWSDHGKRLGDWKLVQEQYFSDYDRMNAVADPSQQASIEGSDLKRELAQEALWRAQRARWVDYPSQARGIGYKIVLLADNEWLPVTLSPFLGCYDRGTTPLMHASLLGDLSRIQTLVAGGANVNESTPEGFAALGYAAMSDNPAAVTYLLKAGAKVNARPHGSTALVAAVVSNHPENVDILLRAGADPNSRNQAGESVLSLAKGQNCSVIIRLLEKAGARQ